MVKLTKEEKHRDQGDAGGRCGLLFMACADRIFAEFHWVDIIPYAGVVCGVSIWHGDSGNHRGVLATQICVYRFLL